MFKCNFAAWCYFGSTFVDTKPCFITPAKPLMESKVRHRSFIPPEDIDLLISNYTDGRLSNTSRSIRRNGKIASFIVLFKAFLNAFR